MKIFRNRIIIAIICIIFAAAIAFVLIPSINQNKEATVFIVRAARDIQMGNQIVEEDIVLVEVGAYNMRQDVLTDSSLAIGKFASIHIQEGDAVTTVKISDTRFESLTEEALHEGKQLVTVSLGTVAAGIGGHIHSGDIVSALIFISETDQSGVVTTRVERPGQLQKLMLFDLENAKAKSVGTKSLIGSVVTDDDIPRTATLLVDEEQAKLLIQAEYTGKIHLVYHSKGFSEGEGTP